MKKFRIFLLVTLMLTLLVGCNLPVGNDKNAAPAGDEDAPGVPDPVSPLPPALVESLPLPGSRIGVGGEIHLYFNQPMDRDSVESALSGDPALNGTFSWPDDHHLVFTPAEPWPPNAPLNLTVASSAASQDGLKMEAEARLEFQAADYLRLVQSLPFAETSEIDPESAVVASFNQPVIPLGAVEGALEGFSISPAAQGRGEWLNTSTYVFYPDPALTGGQTYTVSLNPELQSVEGTPLEQADSWQFTTLPPAYEAYSPRKDALHIRLDAPVTITFNQAMDPSSVEKAFTLVDEKQSPVPGQFEWSEDYKSMIYQPDELLARGQRYTFVLPAGVLSSGGTPIADELRRSFYAATELFVLETEPGNGGVKPQYSSVSIKFNAPLATEDPGEFISVSPEVKFRTEFYPGTASVNLFGNFEAEETYTVQVRSGLVDIWGSSLAYEYTFSFKTEPLSESFRTAVYQGSGVLFVNPDRPLISAQVVNIDQVAVQTTPVSLEELLYFQHTASYEEVPQPSAGQTLGSVQGLSIARNRNQVVGIELNTGKGLAPGLYWVLMDPIPGLSYSAQAETFAVVSHVQMVLKFSAANALVWAIDTRSGAPVQDAPVQIINRQGVVLAEGFTDGTGLFTAEVDLGARQSTPIYAMLSEPGAEYFSLAKSDWSQGVRGGRFGPYTSLRYPALDVYLYTDRPIYRPGDEVSYRAVARDAFNGRYEMPDDEQITLAVRDSRGDQIEEVTLPLSEYGTVHGSFTLSQSAQPGYYEIYVVREDTYSGMSFQVAEYRKPEIDLELGFDKEDYLAGEALGANVSARYFFDAPAAGNEIQWNLYEDEGYFSLPGYRVGPAGWYNFNPYFWMESGLGDWLTGDTGLTSADGSYAVQYTPVEIERTMVYTLESTVLDESGQPVSSRAATTVHPEEIYIGIKTDSWLGRVETETIFDIKVVDWARNSAGVRDLSISIGEITWEPGAVDRFGFPAYEKRVEVFAELDAQTNTDGILRLPFTPADPGMYQIEVRSGNALTQYTLWVGGPGRALWPDFDQQELELKADQESYQPGDVASVFIPNPFPGEVLALVTQERGEILDQQIIKIEESGFSLPVSLTDDSAPNVYLTVTLLGAEQDGELGFRYGVVNLPVEPESLLLNVEVLGEPEKAAPGEPVELQIKVTDQAGHPVQGEFSVAVVDEAVLALADRFEQSIMEAYYGNSGLGVITGLSLAADAELYFDLPGGLGGGGGGDMPPDSVRDDFRDTAFWQADVVTNAEGIAVLTITLPDNLTTWQVLARGLTMDTLVGEGVSEVITSKPLMIRPVTPRFVVAGDELELAAVVHNNTDQAIEAEVLLTASGFELADPAQARQAVEVAAGGRARVAWWGAVEKADELDLVFAVQGGGLTDASEPTGGPIPVIGFTAPQAYLTAGTLDEGGERLELVSLPRSFDPAGGGLRLELSTSLAGVAFEGLEAMDSYYNHSNEYIVSSFLPNLELLLAIREFGLDEAGLEAQLEEDLRTGISKLQSYQNYDGGWSWYHSTYADSSPNVSAYVLLGLVKAKAAGFEVNDYVIENAVSFLRASTQLETWADSRAALVCFVLLEAGESVPHLIRDLEENVDQMEPWAQALTAHILASEGQPAEADSIFSNLQGTAVRSATGVHWVRETNYWYNLSSNVTNNAIVVYALAQSDPASPIVTDAVRYLMSHRDVYGGWGSSYATSWALMALTEVMRGTGELGGEFEFSASLNDTPLATGEAGGPEQYSQVVAETGLDQLRPDLPNALKIQRDPGQGRLYYRAHLNVLQPVDTIEGVNRGVGVSRAYYLSGQDCGEAACSPVTTARVGDLLTVRLTINLDQTRHYLTVKDYIPAGTEVLDLSLKTSQLGASEEEVQFEPEDPYAYGWGWWYFGGKQVYDDHIVWTSDMLPAGTYELTYTLVVIHPGIFQAIPAQAQQIYFPEVQGISAGSVLEVLP